MKQTWSTELGLSGRVQGGGGADGRSDRDPPKVDLAVYRLRSHIPGSDGRCRWCEEHANEYVKKDDESKQLPDFLEDPSDVPLPAVLKCLDNQKICGTFCSGSCP
eukprot:COSAG06_NODE_30311_length_541_cov_0.728507_2_plen_104_part_01